MSDGHLIVIVQAVPAQLEPLIWHRRPVDRRAHVSRLGGTSQEHRRFRVIGFCALIVIRRTIHSLAAAFRLAGAMKRRPNHKQSGALSAAFRLQVGHDPPTRGCAGQHFKGQRYLNARPGPECLDHTGGSCSLAKTRSLSVGLAVYGQEFQARFQSFWAACAAAGMRVFALSSPEPLPCHLHRSNQ